MAGLNTRFHDVGFDMPKYLLPWGSKTIIYEIVSELTKEYAFEQIILLANKRDIYFKEELLKAIAPLNLNDTNIFYIGDTEGQGHTAAIGASLATHPEQPFFVHNADTIVSGRDINGTIELLKKVDALIDVFVANSPGYSYVKVTASNRVQKIVEKLAISPFASSGLYCFQSAETYLDYYNKTLQRTNNEMYVADILSDMLKDDRFIIVNQLNQICETVVLGSPQEYGLELAKKSLKSR